MDQDSFAVRIAAILQRQTGGTSSIEDMLPRAGEILAALRRPTPRITKAGADIPVGCCMTNASDAGEVWDYMIEAAIAEANAPALPHR